jgi:hypothetical protein
MMTAICGLTSPKQFAEYDPDTRSLRTWPDIGLWGSIEFSETLPKHGMTCGGAVFELLMSEHPTAGSGCSSLLPTPAAMNPNDGESVETWEARRQRVMMTAANGNGFGTPLAIAIQLLPSPRTSDANGAGAHGTGGPDLRTVVSTFPTPTANDWRGPNRTRRDDPARQTSLPDIVDLLPTPTSRDGKGANQRGDETCLTGALLPTPRAARGASGTETMYGLGAVRSDEGRPQGEVLLPTPTVMDYKASGGSTTSDVTLTDAIVRTSLGAHTNTRFDGGSGLSDDEPLHLLSGTLAADND